MRVNISSSGAFSRTSGPMISCTSPPEQKLSPAPGDHHGVHVGGVLQLAEQVAQLGVRLEGQRVLALGPVQRDGGHAVLHLPEEVLGAVAGQLLAVAGGQRRVHALS